MSKQQIKNILEKLHNTTEKPRLEIEGAGEPSAQASYLRWIQWKKQGEGETAVYVIRDYYEDTSFVTSFNTECLKLPKSGIESLVEYVLSSKGRAVIQTKGIYLVHDKTRNDYTDSYSGSPAKSSEVLVELTLDLQDDKIDKPNFNLSQITFTQYPKDLPLIAIANRIPLCINCSSIWLEPFTRRNPDFNHCSEMCESSKTYKNLSQEQKERFEDLSKKGVLCPLFEQTKRYS